MAATWIKVAYALFFFSFSMWIAILLSVCFQSGRWANPIQFPSYTFLGMFVASAIASSLACMIIGFEYLGLGEGFTRRVRTKGTRTKGTRTFGQTKSSHVRLRAASKKREDSENLNGDYYVLLSQNEQMEDLNLLVLASKRKQVEHLQVIPKSELIDETVVVANPKKKENSA